MRASILVFFLALWLGIGVSWSVQHVRAFFAPPIIDDLGASSLRYGRLSDSFNEAAETGATLRFWAASPGPLTADSMVWWNIVPDDFTRSEEGPLVSNLWESPATRYRIKKGNILSKRRSTK